MKDGVLARDENFARDIKKERTKRGLSHLEMGHLLGCSTARIKAFEAGERQPQQATVTQINHVLFEGKDFPGKVTIGTPKQVSTNSVKAATMEELVAEIKRRGAKDVTIKM